MVEKTLTDEIITIVQSVANNNPAPRKCTITKIYENNFIDAKTEDGILKYVETIGTPVINQIGIILYLDGDLNKAICITK